MSSHHVVKEDQEPALVIAEARAIPFTIVEQLLEWSPAVIVLEDTLDEVMTWGIKFDVLVCRYDRVPQHAASLAAYAPLKILSHQPGERPLDTALMFLLAGKYKSVNLLGVAPASIGITVTGMDVVAFYSGLRWSFVHNGRFEKWLTKGIALRFIANGSLMKKGLVDDIVGEEGMVTLTADAPFWVGEPYA